MAGKVEVGVLHDIHGSLLVCCGLKYDLQHAFSGHDVGQCCDERARVSLRKIHITFESRHQN